MGEAYQDDYSAAADFSQFEDQKENIQPLRKGRSAAKLVEIFSQDEATRLRYLDEQKQAFEVAVAAVDLDQDEDPLDAYSRYVRWTLENYPQGHNSMSQLVPLLERTLHQFQDDERYKNDPRYLKLWLVYVEYSLRARTTSPPIPAAAVPRAAASVATSSASARPTLAQRDSLASREEIFKFLLHHGIGENLSLLYEEYGMFLESIGKFDLADETLKLGINRRAQPLERLKRRYQEFQTRQAYRATHQADDPEEGLSSTSQALSSSAANRSHGRPVLGRKPLSRPLAGIAAAGGGQPSAQSRSSTLPVPSSTSSSNFTIFSDSTLPATGQIPDEATKAPTAPWIQFGSQASRRKENIPDATVWTGVQIPQSGRVRPGQSTAPISATGAGSSSKFMVYQDDGTTATAEPNKSPRSASPDDDPSARANIAPLHDEAWPGYPIYNVKSIKTQPPLENLPIVPANSAHRAEFYVVNLQWVYQETHELSLEELWAMRYARP
ncbi:protein kinase [Dimargaris verticillata]|uniref:Protein kinase n=1 Tax=Dimargaris verticillata TaxID=2761393 RepID=A0A9W8EB38_9FUNG|nr:protein kinase [Dimargaris verticillata]